MTELLQPWDMPGVTSVEASLLRSAAACSELPALADISVYTLRKLSEREGIELATAVLFDRIVRSSLHGSFIKRIESLRIRLKSNSFCLRATLVIIPGAYYVEYPEIGGDGRVLRDVAASLHCRTEMVPTVSVGGLQENARRINQELLGYDGPIVLVSLSKGGADVKAALTQPNAAAAFRNVVAWADFCGITHGTPLAGRVTESRWLTALARAIFWLRGHDFQMVRDLAPRPGGPLDGPPRLPQAMHVIHVVGFPLAQHPATRLIRRHYQHLAPLGPNDGCSLLGDLPHLPGLIYPIWGVDHYLRPSWDIRTLALAILIYLGQMCSLLEE